MNEAIAIVECPRDGWQGLPVRIPAQIKAGYLRKLIAAGFRHIDAVSFVSPSTIPQTADSEEVLALLDAPSGVEIVGIVVNARGAERAIATGRVSTLGFPYSVSEQFLERNQRQTRASALQNLAAVGAQAGDAGLKVVAYLSMAFGNPYGEAWSLDDVSLACERLSEAGVKQISLADTVGLASPERVAETVARVAAIYKDAQIGVHLHAQRDGAAAKIRAAYQAGCRRFDAAIGGLGGCPFAQDALVGNIPTEILIAELEQLGAQVPKLGPLDEFIRDTRWFANEFGRQPAVSRP